MFLYKMKDLPCYTEYRKKEIKQKKNEKEKTKMKKFFEEYSVEEYEIDYLSISNSRYEFKRYRECSTYESGYFYAEDCDDFYCNVHIERIA